ncbi:hypothetical protein Q2T40_02775 [Winogradskyella maritima]|nr:hypothetical protein [Winogradskyella maritima]
MLTTLDLVNVENDQVPVSINPGAFSTDQVFFYIPKTVPGTYSEDNYGKYIEDFKALDYEGNELTFEKLDENTWKIQSGKNLGKVTYRVNDTYDTESETSERYFLPREPIFLRMKILC